MARRRKSKNSGTGGKAQIYHAQNSPLLSQLRRTYRGTNVGQREGSQVTIRLPKIFSFIRNPEESGRVIYSVLQASGTDCTCIFLDYQPCEASDLCAAMTLGVIAQEIVKEWRMRRVPRRFAGTWSHNVHVRDVMRTTGIIEHLNIKHEAPTPEVKTRFEMFNLVRGFVPSVRSFRSYALSWTAHCKSHRVKLTPKSIKSMMQPRKRFLKSVQAKQKRCKLAVGYLMRGETNYSNGSCACIASPLGVKSRMSILSQKSTSPARRKSRATTEDTEARLLLKLNRMIARAAPRAALKRVAALNRFYSDIAAEIRRVG